MRARPTILASLALPGLALAPGLATPAAAGCPQTLAEWRAYRDDWARAYATTRNVGQLPDFAELARCYAESAPLRSAKPALQACLQNFATYFRVESGGVPASITSVAPEKTEVPPEIRDAFFMGKLTGEKEAEAAVRELRGLNPAPPAEPRYLVLKFKSETIQGLDGVASWGRILVVKKGVPDQWIQLTYTTDDLVAKASVGSKPLRTASGGKDPHTVEQNISVVSVEKDASGQTQTYFADHSVNTRVHLGMVGKSEIKRREEKFNCAECHAGGVLTIRPAPGSIGPEDQPVLDAINQLALSYPPTRFGAHGKPEDFGLELGAMDPASVGARTDALLKRCTDGIVEFKDPARGFENLRAAMNCASCHKASPGSPKPLRFPLALASFIDRVGFLDNQGKPNLRPMPAHALSKDPVEDQQIREALKGCLMLDYVGKLPGLKGAETAPEFQDGAVQRWLMAGDCGAPDASSAIHAIGGRNAPPGPAAGARSTQILDKSPDATRAVPPAAPALAPTAH